MTAPCLLTPSAIGPAEMAATRREFFALLGAAGLLTGCSTAPDTGPAPADGYPRTVRDATGTVTIDARPTRVFTSRTAYELDALLALGVVPALIARPLDRGSLQPWQQAVADVPALDADAGPDLERLLADGIDLIVSVENLLPDELTSYARVAPGLALPFFDFARQFAILTEALDLDPAAGQERLRDIDALFAAFTPQARPASIAAFLDSGDGNVVLAPPGGNLSRLLERVGLPGLTAPAGALPYNPGPDSFIPVSKERLGEVADVDLLLGLDYENPAALDALATDPLFTQLPAVCEGRFARVGGPACAAIGQAGVLNLPTALDALRTAVATWSRGAR